MGGRLSPVLADIFCHMMEKEIILKHFENGHILHYNRYVDDCVLIMEKGKESIVLTDMNGYDSFLKFTYEKMENESLPFLDTKIYLDARKVPQLKFYRKPTASDVKLNFKKSVTPKKYLISTLIGEIYRVVRCTSTESDKEDALGDLKELFLRNEYPERLISTKVAELRSRDFKILGNCEQK